MLRETGIGGGDGLGIIPVDDVALELHVVRQGCRREPLIVQHPSRIVPVGADIAFQKQRLDLLPIADFAAPEGRTPGCVDCLQGPILLLQPVPEGRPAGRTGAVIAVQFIVDLPGEYPQFSGVALCHLLHDPSRILPECGADHAAVALDAQIRGLSVRSPLDRVRVILVEPQRRAVGRRTQNDLHSMAGDDVDRIIQPRKVERAVPRLHPAPGELSDPDNVGPGLRHTASVFLPEGSVPMLWVVVDSNSYHSANSSLQSCREQFPLCLDRNRDSITAAQIPAYSPPVRPLSQSVLPGIFRW